MYAGVNETSVYLVATPSAHIPIDASVPCHSGAAPKMLVEWKSRAKSVSVNRKMDVLDPKMDRLDLQMDRWRIFQSISVTTALYVKIL